MTTFERDMKGALEGNEIEVLKRRKAEIERLNKEGRACKNGFRRQCIAQELAKRIEEYEAIDRLF